MSTEDKENHEKLENEFQQGLKAIEAFFGEDEDGASPSVMTRKKYCAEANRLLGAYTDSKFKRPDIALELGRVNQSMAYAERNSYDDEISMCQQVQEAVQEGSLSAKYLRKQFQARSGSTGRSIILASLDPHFLKSLPKKKLQEAVIDSIENGKDHLKRTRDNVCHSLMQRAMEAFTKASAMEEAQPGHPAPALAKLSMAYIHMDTVFGSNDEWAHNRAFQLAMESATAGCTEAQVLVARMFLDGEVVGQDYSGAKFWAEEALQPKKREHSPLELLQEAQEITSKASAMLRAAASPSA